MHVNRNYITDRKKKFGCKIYHHSLGFIDRFYLKELREDKEDEQYTYCGFKPGFLIGQSF